MKAITVRTDPREVVRDLLNKALGETPAVDLSLEDLVDPVHLGAWRRDFDSGALGVVAQQVRRRLEPPHWISATCAYVPLPVVGDEPAWFTLPLDGWLLLSKAATVRYIKGMGWRVVNIVDAPQVNPN